MDNRTTGIQNIQQLDSLECRAMLSRRMDTPTRFLRRQAFNMMNSLLMPLNKKRHLSKISILIRPACV